jgi:hypothetical protein
MATHMSPLEAVVATITVVLGVLGLWRVLLSTRARHAALPLSIVALVVAFVALCFIPWVQFAQAVRAWMS